MKIVDASWEIEFLTPLQLIESSGRTCYKSEGREIDHDTAEKFTRMLIRRGHESVIEHSFMTVRFIVDRGVSHELVRHRLAAYSQESTRYCNYSKDRFGSEITVIRPWFWHEGSEEYQIWYNACLAAEAYYFRLLANGVEPGMARSVLPNSLKTEIVVSANLREWRHILRLRCAEPAHSQIREVMVPLLQHLKSSRRPSVFEDIEGVPIS